MDKKNKDILLLAGGVIALFLIITVSSLISPKTSVEKTKIITDKKEYKISDTLKINIKNDLKTDAYFSSCFPYYFEKKDGIWESYQYINCPAENLAEKCINSKQTKAFELNIPTIEEGIYRLAIPACIGCNFHDKFREDEWFYSNKFTVK